MSPAGSVNGSLICGSGLEDGSVAGRTVAISGQDYPIIVHRDGNTLRAWFNRCPHQGRSLDYVPGRFLLDRGRLVCAAHGACFELVEGRCVAGPCLGDRLEPVALEPLGDDTWRVSDPGA